MKKFISIVLLLSPFFLISCGTNSSTNTENQSPSSDTSWNKQGQNQWGVNTRTRAS